MHCLKCGCVIPEDQVFCDACLTEMDRYPVPQETVLQLPVRKTEEPPKRPSRKVHRALSPEEQIQRQKSTIHSLAVTLVLVILTMGMFLGALLIYYFKDERLPIIGQNYQTEETQTSTGE